MSYTFILAHDLARERALQAVKTAPQGFEVCISAPSKTRAQEERYHAMFGDVAQQCTHLNENFDLEGWKRLLVDQFSREMLKDPTCDEDIRDNLKNAVRMVPSLDGQAIVALGMSTKKFRKKTASAFMEWLAAFAAEHGVQFKEAA